MSLFLIFFGTCEQYFKTYFFISGALTKQAKMVDPGSFFSVYSNIYIKAKTLVPHLKGRLLFLGSYIKTDTRRNGQPPKRQLTKKST